SSRKKPATAREFRRLSESGRRQSPLDCIQDNKQRQPPHMAALRTLVDALLTTDRRQRFRLAQAWLASVMMCFCVLALHIANGFGLVDPGPIGWWSAASVAG